ncbi:MAG: DUF2141 domain-containing protein [Mongoliibacter sp.]|uniref:DUF2141 domain-containing protein n=1 Tax=Mongoliibacter sp. TaxID=2022438 RepID=UPI0012EF526C|nr:DUF2141 domain-containing protein [Mongoliibacter sp.]TVP51910.1 MAG: DUF2141 domain-containing protein [Mongoliibacter sp.]
MKYLLIVLAAIFLYDFEQRSTDLTLEVTNVKDESGVIRVLLFKGESGFPGDVGKAFRNASVPIKGNKATIVFKDLPEGEYALSVFHDSLNTGKLRTNAMGIPRDGYGFSNNASGTFGPPKYKDASFKVTTDQNQVSIKLR